MGSSSSRGVEVVEVIVRRSVRVNISEGASRHSQLLQARLLTFLSTISHLKPLRAD